MSEQVAMRPEQYCVQWRGLNVICEIEEVTVNDKPTSSLHVSISAFERKPSDAECIEALVEWAPKEFKFREIPAVINPYVRHFFEDVWT